MRSPLRLLAVSAALLAPAIAAAQFPHDDMAGRHDDRKEPEKAAPLPRGILPSGSPRQVEVLVVSFGFSPSEIQAEQGESVVLTVRRSDEARCKRGLAIPSRQIVVPLPVGETVPVTLKLERAETIQLRCASEDVQASIVVAPR